MFRSSLSVSFFSLTNDNALRVHCWTIDGNIGISVNNKYSTNVRCTTNVFTHSTSSEKITHNNHNNNNNAKRNNEFIHFAPCFCSCSYWTVNCTDSLFLSLHIFCKHPYPYEFVYTRTHTICVSCSFDVVNKREYKHTWHIAAHTFAIRTHTHVPQQEWNERSTDVRSSWQTMNRKKRSKKNFTKIMRSW